MDKTFRDTAAARAPFWEEMQELWAYRSLVYQLVRRDVVTRYQRSALGIAWTMLNPLGMMLILSVVFSQLMPTQPDYPAFILSGLVAWNFFSQSSSVAVSYLIDGGNLFRSIYVPPSVFVVAGIGTGLVNLILSIVPLIVVAMIVGVPLNFSMLFLPLPVMLLVGFTLGVSLIISTFAVYFRDTTSIYQLILTGWIYLSPVFFPEHLLNEQFRTWLSIFNPMYAIIRLFRMPIYDGKIPFGADLGIAFFFSTVTLITGWIIFTQKCDEFSYRI